MFTQLNPSIPMEAVGKGSGEAIGVIDYSKEDNLLWVIALDSTGEVWTVPNHEVRLLKNYSIGRTLEKK